MSRTTARFFAASGGEHNFPLAFTPITHAQPVEGIIRIGAAIAPAATT